MRKKIIVFSALLLAIFLLFFRSRTTSELEKNVVEEQVSVVRKKRSIEKAEEFSFEEIAREGLEASYRKLNGSEVELVQESLAVAFNYVESFIDVDEIVPRYSERLQLTSKGMLQSLVFLHSLGYHYDEFSLEVYESSNDGIYQFIFQMESNDGDRMIYNGNYVVSTGQLEIVNQMGVIESHSDAVKHEH